MIKKHETTVGGLTNLHPFLLLAIDETLYLYRGHIGFMKYNPKKPAKHGLLYLSLCDSPTPYTYYSLPYAGKPEKVEGPDAKYYITGTDEYSKYLIDELPVYCNLQGINISMNRYFTSVSLSTWASEKNITIVGSMEHDQKDILKELSQLLIGRKVLSCMFIIQKRKSCLFLTLIKRKVVRRM